MLYFVVCFVYSYAYKESCCLIIKDEIFFKIIYIYYVYNLYVFMYKYIIIYIYTMFIYNSI